MNQPNSHFPTDSGEQTGPGLFASPLRVWRGEASLALVFWGYGVFVSALLISGFIAALYNNSLWMQEALLVVTLVYTLWVLAAIWRCPTPDTSVWWLVARALTVAWAVNIVLVSGFLHLNILETALGL